MGWFGFCFERERLSADLQAQLSLTGLGWLVDGACARARTDMAFKIIFRAGIPE
jgi:hypothetical protein